MNGSAVPAESAVVTVRGGGLTAAFAPGRGAKIVSLHDGIREWLAQPAAGAAPPAPGTPFVEAEMAGWDECAPSIVACTVGGRDIPDHGSLWDAEFASSGATATYHGAGFSFSRTVEAAPEGLVLRYRARSDGTAAPFLWAAHPQFVAPPGTSVRLPVPDPVVFDVLAPVPRETRWSGETATIDTVPVGGCRKIYLDPAVRIGAAELVHPDGRVLSLEWSQEAPYLGVWFDRGAFSREPVIALEPSTGYYDSLAIAVASDRVSVLEPGRTLEWWVAVRASGSP